MMLLMHIKYNKLQLTIICLSYCMKYIILLLTHIDAIFPISLADPLFSTNDNIFIFNYYEMVFVYIQCRYQLILLYNIIFYKLYYFLSHKFFFIIWKLKKTFLILLYNIMNIDFHFSLNQNLIMALNNPLKFLSLWSESDHVTRNTRPMSHYRQ